jgi:hypothetical protein
MSRFAAAVLLLAVVSSSFASANRLINKDSLDTYRQALAEKNHLKANAMLQGLLVDSVSIGIDAKTIETGNDDYVKPIQQAISLWNTALGQPVFRMAAKGQAPQVIVKFVPRVSDGDGVQGYVTAQRHFFWDSQESGADVSGTIQIRDNIGTRYLLPDEVCRVMAHELGHVLGLDDDPDGPGLMADFCPGKGIRLPSAEERGALVDFRDQLRLALKSH